jgi:hypothetical protein
VLLCRVEFNGEPKPVFGDQQPSIPIFRRSGMGSPVKALLCQLAISVGRHNTHLKTTSDKSTRGKLFQVARLELSAVPTVRKQKKRPTDVIVVRDRSRTVELGLRWFRLS